MLDAAVDLLRSSLAGNDWFRGVDVVAAPEGPVIRVHVATGSEPIVPTHIEGIPVVIARELSALGAPFSALAPAQQMLPGAKDFLDPNNELDPSALNPVPGCKPPDRITKDAFQGYAACAGESKAMEWAKNQGFDPQLVKNFLDGDITWRDAAQPFLAGYGFQGDPTQVIRDDGSVDWREAAGQGGAFAAYAACSSQPETAPVASLCGKVGYMGGKYLYDYAAGAWQGFRDWAFGGGPQYPPLPNTIPTEKQDALRLIGSIYLQKGQSDYLFNLAMLRGIALQFFAIARGIESSMGVNGIEAFKRAGYAGPLGWRSLVSSSRPFSEPITPGGPYGGESLWRIWEHELVEALAEGVPPSPLVAEDPDHLSPYYDLWTIEHTNQFVGVRCGGVLDPNGKLGLPQKPLFQYISSGHQYGAEAASYGCTGKYANTWVEVHVDPQVRHFCEQDRSSTRVLKDAMLMALQSSAERAVFQAAQMRRLQIRSTPMFSRDLIASLAPASGEDDTDPCGSYGTYLSSHRTDLFVVGGLALLGAIAGAFIPRAPKIAEKTRLTTKTRGAAAGGGVGLLLGAGIAAASHASWKKKNCPPAT